MSSKLSEIVSKTVIKQTTELYKNSKSSCLNTTDQLIVETDDLQNKVFHNWYCKIFYKLGKEKVLQLASIARADAQQDKRHLFSRLLKNAYLGV